MMKVLVFTCMLSLTMAESLQSYSLPSFTGPGYSSDISSSSISTGSGFLGGSSTSSGFSSGSSFSSGGLGYSGFASEVGSVSEISCGEGQVRHVDGSCVTPQVTRNLFLYEVPPATPIVAPRPNVPPPRIEHNTIFIRTPEGLFNQEPVVIPPPQQRNVVYVLSKRPHIDHTVVNAPEQEQAAPEVYFVNYAEGENPTLPLGGDLESALSAAAPGGGELVQSSGGNFRDSIDVVSGVGGVSSGDIGFGGDGGVGVGGSTLPLFTLPPTLYRTP